MDEDEIVLTAADLKSYGYCVSGQRGWFQAHGIDFKNFVRNGMKIGEAKLIDDAAMQESVRRKLDQERAKWPRAEKAAERSTEL